MQLMPEGDVLTLYFRGFDGAYYKMREDKAGDPGGKFGPPTRLGGFSDDPHSIIE